MARPRIRVESHDRIVGNAKIIYIPDEGDEVDISNCVTGIDLHLHVGETARATLHTVYVEGHVTAELHDVFIKHIKPKRRRWWQRIAEITRFGSDYREYTSR